MDLRVLSVHCSKVSASGRDFGAVLAVPGRGLMVIVLGSGAGASCGAEEVAVSFGKVGSGEGGFCSVVFGACEEALGTGEGPGEET
jgi:hypothetical protein